MSEKKAGKLIAMSSKQSEKKIIKLIQIMTTMIKDKKFGLRTSYMCLDIKSIVTSGDNTVCQLMLI